MSGAHQGVFANQRSLFKPPGLKLYRWGYGAAGTLGNNSVVSVSSPIQIGSADWISMQGAFDHVMAIREDNTLWAWGGNFLGQLGDNSNIAKSSPIQVGALANWKQVSCSLRRASAVKTDGTLWGWGSNGAGTLGLGFSSSGFNGRSSPTQVGALTNWENVSAAGSHTAARKFDGTVWTWGFGSFGRLGHNNITNRFSPVQVGTRSDWAQISAGEDFTIALDDSGRIYTWGDGSFGRLGHNNRINRSSPIQVGALTNWAFVVGGALSWHAIKTDGTLWACGAGFNGQLGIGNIINRSSPVQVGALSNWARVYKSDSGRRAMAIKTDGTLWAWGSNAVGALGINNVVNRSSPVQVGALTNWVEASTSGSGAHGGGLAT